MQKLRRTEALAGAGQAPQRDPKVSDADCRDVQKGMLGSIRQTEELDVCLDRWCDTLLVAVLLEKELYHYLRRGSRLDDFLVSGTDSRVILCAAGPIQSLLNIISSVFSVQFDLGSHSNSMVPTGQFPAADKFWH